jgi:hypothetical protein
MKEDLKRLVGESRAGEGRNRVREYLQAMILGSLQRAGAFVPLAFKAGPLSVSSTRFAGFPKIWTLLLNVRTAGMTSTAICARSRERLEALEQMCLEHLKANKRAIGRSKDA